MIVWNSKEVDQTKKKKKWRTGVEVVAPLVTHRLLHLRRSRSKHDEHDEDDNTSYNVKEHNDSNIRKHRTTLLNEFLCPEPEPTLLFHWRRRSTGGDVGCDICNGEE